MSLLLAYEAWFDPDTGPPGPGSDGTITLQPWMVLLIVGIWITWMLLKNDDEKKG